jgi:hypothetical protein
MDAQCLQDWITLSAAQIVHSLPQSVHEYLDICQHEDLVFYLNVTNVVGTPTLSYETSPTREETTFLPMLAPIALAAGPVRVDRAAFATAAVPPARFVRWRIAGNNAAWSATFRIWVAAYTFT